MGKNITILNFNTVFIVTCDWLSKLWTIVISYKPCCLADLPCSGKNTIVLQWITYLFYISCVTNLSQLYQWNNYWCSRTVCFTNYKEIDMKLSMLGKGDFSFGSSKESLHYKFHTSVISKPPESSIYRHWNNNLSIVY